MLFVKVKQNDNNNGNNAVQLEIGVTERYYFWDAFGKL